METQFFVKDKKYKKPSIFLKCFWLIDCSVSRIIPQQSFAKLKLLCDVLSALLQDIKQVVRTAFEFVATLEWALDCVNEVTVTSNDAKFAFSPVWAKLSSGADSFLIINFFSTTWMKGLKMSLYKLLYLKSGQFLHLRLIIRDTELRDLPRCQDILLYSSIILHLRCKEGHPTWNSHWL